MNTLNLPPYQIKTKIENGRTMILDMLRKKYVTLTPEEWVRQHFIHFLIEHKGYPTTLLQNEVELHYGEKKLRCDSILYRSDCSARMIIEYKAPTVQITQKVFDQISVYNMLLHVDYLIISNGINSYCCKMDYKKRTYSFLEEIPEYNSLTES